MDRFGLGFVGNAVCRTVASLFDIVYCSSQQHAVLVGPRGESPVHSESPEQLFPAVDTATMSPSPANGSIATTAEAAASPLEREGSLSEAPITRRQTTEVVPRTPSRGASEDENVDDGPLGSSDAQSAPASELYEHMRYMYSLTLVGPADESCLARLQSSASSRQKGCNESRSTRSSWSSHTSSSSGNQATSNYASSNSSSQSSSSCSSQSSSRNSSPASALPTGRCLASSSVATTKAAAAQQARPKSSLQGDCLTGVLAYQAACEAQRMWYWTAYETELKRNLATAHSQPTAGADKEDVAYDLVNAMEVAWTQPRAQAQTQRRAQAQAQSRAQPPRRVLRRCGREYHFYHGAEASHL